MDAQISSHLLIDGYIRHVEVHLCKQIIPDVIRQLCIKYYTNTSKKLWFLSNNPAKHPSRIYVSPDIDIQSDDTLPSNAQNSIKHTVRIYDAAHPDTFTYLLDKCAASAVAEGTGVYCSANFVIPKRDTLSNIAMLRNRDTVNVMFQCKSECFANLFIEQHETNEITGYRWKLPTLQPNLSGCSVLYSRQQQALIAVGGHEGNRKNTCWIRRLLLEDKSVADTGDEWKWHEVNRTDVARQYCSVCFMDEKDRLLFMSNGYQYGGTPNSDRASGRPCMKRTECYNFATDEWMILKNSRFARQKTALYCDQQQRRVYMIGGVDAYGYGQNKFEMYDMHQNVWYRLAPTRKKHGAYPVAWFDEHRNVLCMASIAGDCIECIDLRETAAKWKVVYGDRLQQGLGQLLGTGEKFRFADYANTRLFKFV